MKAGRKIITAVPVGFAEDGTVDLEASRRILRFVAASGVDGAFVLGTTGEFPSLSRTERKALLEACVEELGELPIVAHVGAASRFETLGLIDDARACGIRSIAVITPYYLPTTDAAVLDHYEAVAAASDGLELYAYVFAKATGVAVSDDLMSKVSRLPNMRGAKISGEPITRLDGYRAVVPDGFTLLTGADTDLAVVAEHGGDGVISGVASAFPEPFIRLAAVLDDGDESVISQAQHEVDRVVELVAANPARMKAALRFRGIDAGQSRMSVDLPVDEVLTQLRRTVEQYG
jgi:4-hydroxy-tetrahydrodipicolinate synthase